MSINQNYVRSFETVFSVLVNSMLTESEARARISCNKLGVRKLVNKRENFVSSKLEVVEQDGCLLQRRPGASSATRLRCTAILPCGNPSVQRSTFSIARTLLRPYPLRCQDQLNGARPALQSAQHVQASCTDM